MGDIEISLLQLEIKFSRTEVVQNGRTRGKERVDSATATATATSFR